MRAFTYTEYGPPEVLRLAEVDTPTPKPGELLVRVHATAVTTGDVNARGFVFVPKGLKGVARLMFGLNRPTKPVLGMNFAGVVEGTGSSVSRFKVGDRVFGTTEGALGAYAEFLTIGEGGVVAAIPDALSHAEAAAVPFGGLTAQIYLRDKATLQAGESVLVNGASGEVGVWSVQIAKHMGAEVTGVCSTRNVELVQSLGAARVIDYTREPLSAAGVRYDLIVDTVGTLPLAAAKELLSAKGRLLAVAGGIREMLQAPVNGLRGGPAVIAGPATPRQTDLDALLPLLASGAIHPVIDRSFPFEEMVDAHRYVDTGRKRGSVVVMIQPAAAPQSRGDVA